MDSPSTSGLSEVSDLPREFDEGRMNFFTARAFDTTEGEAIDTAGAFPKQNPDKNWLQGIIRSNSTSFEAKNKFLPSQRGKVTFPLDKLANIKVRKNNNRHIRLDFYTFGHQSYKAKPQMLLSQ